MNISNFLKTATTLLIFGLVSVAHNAQAVTAESSVPNKSSAPKVVVSIAPFHALVSGIMCGVGTPELLLGEGASPHHYNLKPSEVQNLHQADLIFWAGPELESFLDKPLKTISKASIIQLDQTPHLKIFKVRAGPIWQETKVTASEHEHDAAHEHDATHEHEHEHDGTYDHEHEHDGTHGHHGTKDMHFWLDPNNAILLVDYMTRELSKIDKKNANHYQKNSVTLKKQLQAIDQRLKKKLQPIQNVPFLVFHDGYQYFERQYNLNAVGALTLHPEIPISVDRLKTIRQSIIDAKVYCVFSEPQFKPKMVEQLVKDTGIKSGVLDPLGKKTSECGQGYFILLDNLATHLVDCLQGGALDF